MQRHDLSHEIHCPPERLWQLYFDNDFNLAMYEQGLKFPSCKITERTDDGETLRRRMVITPKVEMPRAVVKLVGDRVDYVEIGEWVRSAGVFHWRIELASLGDKVRIGGTMRVVPLGEGQCRRVVAFEVEAKIFGIGKLVEKTTVKNTIEGWNNSAKWINGYVARNPS